MIRLLARATWWSCALLAVLVLMLAVRVPARAQANTVSVSGTLSGSDGRPIARGHVTLTSQGLQVTATSDSQGRFTLAGLTPGAYVVRASAPGYANLSGQTVSLSASNTTLSLTLSRATTSSLTTIGEVSTSAGETISTSSAPSVTLNAQNAAAQGVTAVSSMVWDQLATTPVLPLGGGSNATVTFAIRGPCPSETLVDIDGHRVNNGNTGDFDLSLIDPAALQSLQLVYGIAPSSLVGPDTIGGAINILTLEPTTTPQTLVRGFGGSFGSYGETLQTTGSNGLWGYAVSLHRATSLGSVNQSVLAPPDAGMPPGDETLQSVGSGYFGESMLEKLRYQLGGNNGYGYIQLDFRGDEVNKDISALMTNFTPGPPSDGGGYQSFAGSALSTYQNNWGLDAQVPIGQQMLDGAPANVLLFSYLNSLASQTVSGPALDSQQYLYDQRDLLGDSWLEFDHHFNTGTLSFKYDLGTENLTTDWVQGQIIAQVIPEGLARTVAQQAFISPAQASQSPPTLVEPLSQTERSAAVRYTGDPTSHIHYSLATYFSNYSVFGSSFDPRAGFVWTPTGSTALRASVGTTFQAPQLSELVVPPTADLVPVGGVIYTGNPNLKPCHATEYDLGAEHVIGRTGRQLHLSMDVYRTNMRSPANQLYVAPGAPNCSTPGYPSCPVSYPVNAGDGVYTGMNVQAAQELGPYTRLSVGWDVDSSYLTVIPASIQDGTFVAGEQTLGQPLHKAYITLESTPRLGWGYGAQLNYEGSYNELNRSPYAVVNAYFQYRWPGLEIGCYGTNLTNVYANPFTITNGGILYGAQPGQPMTPNPAYVLQGTKIVLVVTRTM
ncbi:MAG TPA: TonB-dependent receptor [Candidatus Babeliales bacterium]|nr:TonB-dependent receptor [Candidatus Babeliales bacterium]